MVFKTIFYIGLILNLAVVFGHINEYMKGNSESIGNILFNGGIAIIMISSIPKLH